MRWSCAWCLSTVPSEAGQAGTGKPATLVFAGSSAQACPSQLRGMPPAVPADWMDAEGDGASGSGDEGMEDGSEEDGTDSEGSQPSDGDQPAAASAAAMASAAAAAMAEVAAAIAAAEAAAAPTALHSAGDADAEAAGVQPGPSTQPQHREAGQRSAAGCQVQDCDEEDWEVAEWEWWYPPVQGEAPGARGYHSAAVSEDGKKVGRQRWCAALRRQAGVPAG